MISQAPAGELIGIGYSPWTERARWSMDHHRIVYRYTEHTLLLGAWYVRMRLHRPWGDYTVPCWIDQEVRIDDSLRIAQRADFVGQAGAPPLVPAAQVAMIQEAHRRSDEVLDAVRFLAMVRVTQDREAQLEALPRQVPTWAKSVLRGALIPTANLYLTQSFYRSEGRAPLADRMARRVDRIREGAQWFAQKVKTSPFVAGETFTFADICAATACVALNPPEAPYFKQGPGTRRIWSTPQLMPEFASLLAWRDALYRDHRPARTRAGT